MTDVQPAQLPTEILKDKRAINIYLIAVGAVAIVAVLAVVGMLLLSALGREVPTGISVLGGAALGSLGTMLAVDKSEGGA